MAKLFNLVRVATATTGTGTVTLGAATSGHISFASAGAVTGDVVSYAIIDGSNAEVGIGTYSSTGPTLTRTLVNSTTGALLNLSGSAEVMITDLASDHLPHEAVSTPGAFGLMKNLSNVPVWARAGVFQAYNSAYDPITHGSGTGAGAVSTGTGPAGSGPFLSTGTTTTGTGSVRSGTTFTSGELVRCFQNNTIITGALWLADAVSDATNEYRVLFGLHDEWAFGTFGAEGVFFIYDRATYGNHNLRAVTRSGGTSTTTDTGVALASQTTALCHIEYVSASLVRFYVNNTLVATHTTNIPATSVTDVPLSVSIRKSAGTSDRRVHCAQLSHGRFF